MPSIEKVWHPRWFELDLLVLWLILLLAFGSPHNDLDHLTVEVKKKNGLEKASGAGGNQ